MTGVEIAWRTLARERVEEPCINACWMMKREFFRHYAGVEDIYADPVATSVEAFANAGCNLNPQFIMPKRVEEHRACDPFAVPSEAEERSAPRAHPDTVTVEDVCRDIDALPEPDSLARDFDVEGRASAYAEPLLQLREMSSDRTLYIAGFGMPSFMSGYTKWSYNSYLAALALHPDHLRRYYEHGGEMGRLRNTAITRAMERYDLAPVVYGGDDICFNDGPICSVQTLDDLYFPAFTRALSPLVEAGIDIVWHCDGNVLPIVGRLIEIGITGFQGFQEREASIPLEEMVRYTRRDGGKLIFFGSVSVVHTFPFATVNEMKSEVERCFTVAAPGGGFCLSPTSSVLPETPMENIMAFIEHGKEFGRAFLRGEV